MPLIIPPIRAGEVITAERLNRLGDAANRFNRQSLQAPHQLDKGLDPGVSDDVDTDTETADAETYVETSRSTSTQQVFDQNQENYADIERFETFTAVNSEGKTLKFKFNNS